MPEEMTAHNMMAISEFPKEFTTVMEKLLPVLESKSLRNLSMRDLSSIAGMQLSDFYQLMASNIYKNPRPVASHLMLGRAYELLKKRNDKDIAKISAECGFVSTNYFISQFYHRYKVTPKEFVDKES
jgi:AraC-like DNA-binding protein